MPKTQSFILITWPQSTLFLLLATKCPILLATKCPISFIGHKVPRLLATKWPVSFIGHKVANAFALLLPHSLLFGHEVAHAFGVDISCTNTLQDDNMTCFL